MRTSWNILWSRHKGLIVTALSLGFIILAWYSGKYGHSEFEVPFYLLAYVIGGYQKAWEGLQTLIKEKDLDVDLLMVVAAIGAASIGFWRDGAILILIFSLSGALEGYTLERTNDEIKSIMKLRPEEAIVLQGKGLGVTSQERFPTHSFFRLRYMGSADSVGNTPEIVDISINFYQ